MGERLFRTSEVYVIYYNILQYPWCNSTDFLTVEKYDWFENDQKNATEIYEMYDVHSSSLLLFMKI